MFASGHLAAHPLPPGIAGALRLGGYQLLADVGGVGAGRLGPQAFLLIAPDPDPGLPDAGTQLVLHHAHAGDAEAAAYVALAAELALQRLSGYRVALERHGLRSQARLVNPANGAIAAVIKDRHPAAGSSPGAPAGPRAPSPPACRRSRPPDRPRPPPTPSCCAGCCSRSPCATSRSAASRRSSSPIGRSRS